jgi:NADH-quinone oxidoreductase subunit A
MILNQLFNYLFLYLLVLFFTFLSFIFISVSYIFVKQAEDVEKISSYECGFQPFEDSRNRFNVKYYLIAILFIIFDLELIFLIP